MQYFAWLGQVLQGEFGRSLRTGDRARLITAEASGDDPARRRLDDRGAADRPPAGILAAVRKGTAVDYAASAVALSGLSIPNFWLGIMLILLFAVELRWLPASGYVPFFSDPLGALETLVLPAFVLGSGLAGLHHAPHAVGHAEVLRADYVRTARAKGLAENVVINRHALRNALVPVITLSTILFGELLPARSSPSRCSPSPASASSSSTRCSNRDYGVVQGVVLCTAIGFILMNLLADVLYILVNPRLRGA